MVPPHALGLYEELYGCMHCAAAVCERGVRSFVRSGPAQTIPVSHFGNINSAKIWLVATNPKGARPCRDSNVGFRPHGFVSRAELTHAQIAETFDHFSAYFNRPGRDNFFDGWIEILNGIELSGRPQTWERGGICCVDLVKCPTEVAWRGVVTGPDKSLVYGCFAESDPRRYFKRQVQLHGPRVLLFSAGLGSCYSDNRIVNRDVDLRRLWPKDIKETCTSIWVFGSPSRLSIGLGSANCIKRVETAKIRRAIQLVIRTWEARGHGK